MWVEYVGPHIDGVSVVFGSGTVTVRRGVPVEFPDTFAGGLLDQPSNWRACSPPRKTKENDR